MCSWPIIIGLTGPLETFASQAFGRGDVRECGLWMHRCILISTMAFILITVVFLNTEVILVAIGMDAKISKVAQQFAIKHLPGVFMYILFASFEIVLGLIGYSYVCMSINLAILPFHAILSYLFVIYWNMKIDGCAYAFDISYTLSALTTIFVASRIEGFKDAWFFPTL